MGGFGVEGVEVDGEGVGVAGGLEGVMGMMGFIAGGGVNDGVLGIAGFMKPVGVFLISSSCLVSFCLSADLSSNFASLDDSSLGVSASSAVCSFSSLGLINGPPVKRSK